MINAGFWFMLIWGILMIVVVIWGIVANKRLDRLIMEIEMKIYMERAKEERDNYQRLMEELKK